MPNPDTNTDNQGNTNQLTPEQQDAANFANTLASIKRDDGSQKFDNVGTALESIQPKDDHIKNLEEQVAKLTEDANKSRSQEEILAQFLETQQKPAAAEPAAKQEDAGTQSKPLTLEDVMSAMNQRDTDRVAKDNESTVAKALADTYGNKAPAVLAEKAKEMGISVDFLKTVITESPVAAFEILGLSKGSGSNPPVKLSGSQNTEGFNKAAPQKPKSVVGSMFATTDDYKASWDGCHPDNFKE